MMDHQYYKRRSGPRLLYTLKEEADHAYFNTGSPTMTDEAYDGLCQQIDKLQLDRSTRNTVGCIPPQSDKIKLPVYMGSLTKYNDNEKINGFLARMTHTSFIVQEKLDGVSCLYVYDGEGVRLYTRGNGTVGTDITRMITHGLKVPDPRKLDPPEFPKPIVVRGELIVPKRRFEEQRYQLSDSHTLFKNIRNMVSGQLNSKTPDRAILSDTEFVAFEVVEPRNMCLSEQCQFLKDRGFKVVYNRVIERECVEQSVLMDYLERRQKRSEYQIDGLVITINGEYVRNESDNPKYAFAFKIQGETAEVEVSHVKWNLSKSGKYKPQIFIQPVELAGVTISSLTGFHAKYIATNNIGRGTRLLITRSGDVIPHIIAVLDSHEAEVDLPRHSRWQSVDLYHTFEETPDQVVIKQMVHFFTKLNCLNCKDKTISRIYNAGYTTIESIIQAQIEDFSKIEGIGSVLATKLIMSIQTKIKEASIHELLAALNCFGEGIGLRKIQNIDLNNPSKQVKGLSEATLNDKILPFWVASLNRVQHIKSMVDVTTPNTETETIRSKLTRSVSDTLKDRIFVFTGFRDTLLEKQIAQLGGKVTSAISKKTTDLIVATNHSSKSSSKLLKAKNLGIRITTKTELSLENYLS